MLEANGSEKVPDLLKYLEMLYPDGENRALALAQRATACIAAIIDYYGFEAGTTKEVAIAKFAKAVERYPVWGISIQRIFDENREGSEEIH